MQLICDESRSHLCPEADVTGGQGVQLVIRDQGAVVVFRHGRTRAQPRLVGQLRSAQAHAWTNVQKLRIRLVSPHLQVPSA